MTYLIVFLSGILTALPLLFDFLAFLPWISLIPLFYIAEKKRSAYRHGLVFSLGYYGVVYYWFTYLYPLDFAGFSNSASVLLIMTAWLGLSLLQGVGTAFVPFFYRKLTVNDKEIFAPFTAAALWCIMEWAQNLFWFGVPWARLAVTQYKLLPVIQSASLLGSLFVGFLIVLVNGFLLMAVNSFKDMKKVHYSALIAAVLVMANFSFGIIRLSLYEKPDDTITAACIQGNIASGDKWADDSLSASLEIYSELSIKAANESGAKLIVWPETVINSVFLNQDSGVREIISELAKETDAYIAVGSFYGEYDENGEVESHNSIYLFHPDGTVNENVYHKRHLVPFGEYLPMPNLIKAVLPFLAEMNMFSDNLTAGDSSALFETELGKIGALVCFDSIYEMLTVDSVRDGAELMILSTNDSWYLDSAAVYQHNGHAVLRAVENGRCFVRAANTGISSVISQNGRIESYLDPLVSGYASGEVSFNSDMTLYSIVGDLIVWLSFAYISAVTVIKIIDIKNKKPIAAE